MLLFLFNLYDRLLEVVLLVEVLLVVDLFRVEETAFFATEAAAETTAPLSVEAAYHITSPNATLLTKSAKL